MRYTLRCICCLVPHGFYVYWKLGYQQWIQKIETWNAFRLERCSYLRDQRRFVAYSFKKFTNDTFEAVGLYEIGTRAHPCSWKLNTLDTYHRIGKNFSFKQRLNNSVDTGDNSRLIFLRMTIVIMSGQLEFSGSRLLTSIQLPPLLVTDILEVATVLYGWSAFKCVPAVQFLMELFLGMRHPITKRIHSNTRAAVLLSIYLEKLKKGASPM